MFVLINRKRLGQLQEHFHLIKFWFLYRKYSKFNIDIKKENKGRIVPVP